jgi:callose synthase
MRLVQLHICKFLSLYDCSDTHRLHFQTTPNIPLSSLVSNSRYPNNPLILPLSTILIFGALASSIAVPNLFSYLKSVVLGTAASTDAQLLLTWLTGSLLSAAALLYRDSSLLSVFRGGYTPHSSASDDKTLKPKIDVTPQPVYASPHPPTAGPEPFNMFDPADLPPRLSEYANMVYSACEDLGNFFGFQDSSVRNQAEHLLVLLSNNRRYMNSHILPPALQPPSPIHALHAKVFSNYMKWCRYQGVPPNFSRAASASVQGMAAPPSVASRVVDLVLFFCVWGEACNIRHMPECLWYLYHKMMEEYTVSEQNMQAQYPQSGGGRSLYAGHYLDYVVTPIYKIVAGVSVILWCR